MQDFLIPPTVLLGWMHSPCKKNGQYLQFKHRKVMVLAEQGWCILKALEENIAWLPASPALSSFHAVLSKATLSMTFHSAKPTEHVLSPLRAGRAQHAQKHVQPLLPPLCRRDPLQPPCNGHARITPGSTRRWMSQVRLGFWRGSLFITQTLLDGCSWVLMWQSIGF